MEVAGYFEFPLRTFARGPGKIIYPGKIYLSSLEVILSRVSFSPGEKVIRTEEVKEVKEGSICCILLTIIAAGKPRANSKEGRFSQHSYLSFLPLLTPHECFFSFRGVVGGAGDKD